jgi:hypothetical protein
MWLLIVLNVNYNAYEAINVTKFETEYECKIAQGVVDKIAEQRFHFQSAPKTQCVKIPDQKS